jgi:L-serine dehydratase
MGPQRAAKLFLDRLKERPTRIQVDLYGSLAATGKGHMTDHVIMETLSPLPVQIQWFADSNLPLHPNGMIYRAFDTADALIESWEVYSVGGGELRDAQGPISIGNQSEYAFQTAEELISRCEQTGKTIPQIILPRESPDFENYLSQIWTVMTDCIQAGLTTRATTLPGELQVSRKAPILYRDAEERVDFVRNLNLVAGYALAVAEENAAGGTIVTAPTCGSAGVLPAVLYYFHRHYRVENKLIRDGLIVAGAFGSLVASNASISGAQVGCQGEIGTACAMAAAAAAHILGGTVRHIEYAAEMGLEHCLGLTCDPVAGLVQIPCIERNAFAAMRAIECATYSLATAGRHLVSFDQIVEVMNRTGRDLQEKYRETATGGLAEIIAHQCLGHNQKKKKADRKE